MFLRRLNAKEDGNVLPMALISLVLGGVLIASTISYADTMLRHRFFMEKSRKAVYAADAGVEDALWCVKNSVTPRTQLPQNINGYQVNISTTNTGYFTIYAGEFVPASEHVSWIDIGETVEWDGGANAFRYTITITRDPAASGNIMISEVGARLPQGYSYQTDSAGGLSAANPVTTFDGENAELLKWVFLPPRPTLTEADPVASQSFYFTGTGSLSGYYSWVIAEREDIGTVSVIAGDVYQITAQAVEPLGGSIKGQVTTEALKTSEGDLYIIRWQINPN